MSEYADYLLTAIDSCYGVMKKKQPDLVQKVANPSSLFGGKMSEEVECVCDGGSVASSQVNGAVSKTNAATPNTPPTSPHTTTKTVPFQTSYITLTAPLYPITDIRFETFDFTVFSPPPFPRRRTPISHSPPTDL